MRAGIFRAAIALLAAGLLEGRGETLRSAMQRAIEDHPRAKRAEWNTEAIFQESKAAAGALRPQVTLEGSIGPEYRDRSLAGVSDGSDTNGARQARVVVRQLLYDGLLTPKQKEAAEKRFEAAEVLEADVEEAIALDVADAYLGVLRAREQIGLAKANIAVHEESLRKTKERAEAGRGQKADVDLVEARLGLARSSLETRLNLLESANVRYKQLVGREPQSLQWPASIAQGDLPATVNEADLSGNYSRVAAEMAYEAARLDEEASRGTKWPRIDLELSGSAGRDVGGLDGNDSSYSALIVGRWDLYTGGTDSALRMERVARRNEAAELVSETVRLADQDLGEAIADRDGARERANALSDYANSMGEVVNAYEAQLEIGSRAILNVLDVKNEEFRAKSALLDARFEKILAEYRMLAAKSELVSTIVGRLPDQRTELAAGARLREVQTVEPGEGVTVIESIESGEPERRGLFGLFRPRGTDASAATVDASGNTILSRESGGPDAYGGNKVIYVEWQEPDNLDRNKVLYQEGPAIGGKPTDTGRNPVSYREAREAPGAAGAEEAPVVEKLDN